MKRICISRSRLKWIILALLFAILVPVGFYKIPKALSKQRYNSAEKLSGVFIHDDHPDEGLFEVPPGEEVITMFALGDTGTGEEVQYQVGDTMDREAALAKPICVLMLGDNFYPEGVQSADDPMWETHFELPYDGDNLQIPFYACLGNHDHGGDTDAQIARTDKNTRWRMPAANYFVHPDPEKKELLSVIALDTQPIARRHFGHGKNIEKLDDMLSQVNSRWKIVIGHHPIQSGGRPSYYQERVKDKIYETLVKHEVDLYISGHNHVMEMGTVDHTVTYAILGSGGHGSKNFIEIPNMYFGSTEAGFGKIRVLQDRIVLDFINADGKRLYSRAVLK